MNKNLRSWMLLVAALTLHNFEEWALDLPAWAAESSPPPWMASAYAQGGFGVSLIVVTPLPAIAGTLVHWLAPRSEPEWLAVFAWVLILNTASHALLSLITWSLMPGIITAIALLLPSSLTSSRPCPARSQAPTTFCGPPSS